MLKGYKYRLHPTPAQICSSCGEKGQKKAMDVREWTCTHCGAYHDRDINTSLNLLMLAD